MSIDFMITGATTKAIQKTISLGAVSCLRIVVRPPKYKKIEIISSFYGKSIRFTTGGFLYRLFGKKIWN